MTKRLLALLAVFVLVIAACGDTEGDEDTTTTTTTAAPTDVGQTEAGATLQEVLDRGALRCGVSGSAPAFSETQPDGSASGFDADFCRAVAAAVLGDANAVEFRALTAAERFEALKNNEIDVLIRNTTWTQSRDSDIGMDFAPTTYYDGQQLMGRKSFGFTENSTLSDLDGAIVCTNAGTTTEKNVTEGAQLAGATITLETVETTSEALEKFEAGTCDVYTTDGSGLVGSKAQRDTNDEWVIFPSAPISKEPLGPAYRANDSQWADIVNWTVYAMFIADEKGVTSANIDDIIAQGDDIDPELGRLFGSVDGSLQEGMGLPADAFYQVIKQVGNYDEIFGNNLNPLKIFRDGTYNAQWTDGGLIYAPPAR